MEEKKEERKNAKMTILLILTGILLLFGIAETIQVNNIMKGSTDSRVAVQGAVSGVSGPVSSGGPSPVQMVGGC